MNSTIALAAGALAFAGAPQLNTTAQNLLPNPGFELDTNAVVGWRLAGGSGAWTEAAHQGAHAIAVTGNGDDQSTWSTEGPALAPGGLYHLRFYGRRDPAATGGTAVSGMPQVNRDFALESGWREYGFVFRVPDAPGEGSVRLGQWHVKGTLEFDDAELTPAQAVHARFPAGLELGEGESIRGGVYRFTPRWEWAGANYHRPLAQQRASFNSGRWSFFPGAELVYRLRAGQHLQRNGRLRVAINYYISGTLRVEARGDGGEWRLAGTLDGSNRGRTLELPPDLFPTRELLVRLSLAGAEGNLQINACDYEAELADPPSDAEGASHFLDVLHTSPDLGVQLSELRWSELLGRWELELALTNQTRSPLPLRASISTDVETPAPYQRVSRLLTNTARLRLSCGAAEPGPRLLNLLIRDAARRFLFAGRLPVELGFLSDRRPGYWLPGLPDLGVWWCESSWKIGRERGSPEKPRDGQGRPVRVSLARGEYEAAQIVLTPGKDGELLGAKVGDWRGPDGRETPLEARLDEVAYVHVTQPTDASCRPGWYPDPLPPLRPPLTLRAGQNQPLWLTVHVPRAAKAGDYTGEATLETTLGQLTVPLRVHVYRFELPRDTHLHSALGLGSGSINRYHRLTRAEDREAVFEQYLRNFAEHRISPYSFYDYAPIDVRFAGEGTNRQAMVDFARFDRAAAKWLDEYRFNTFQLPLHGMGGGTFQSRYLGELDGFKEGTPEHARLFHDYLSQVERHLRERGWLSQAFTYWFDEPDPKDYAFVVAGMKRLKAAAPGIRRMLTEQPEPELTGHVEIWCGLTPEWTPEKVRARQAAGEEVWWYICTGPKAPYVTEFIDHPGTELRLWPWQSWQYGVRGLLIWATVYWNSPLVYREPNVQDPWRDPMSWVSGYDFPVGHQSPWGNGDGRFLYPPRRDPNASTAPNLEAPISSVRWENLRDGMEDYEYLWLLEQAVQRAAERQAAGAQSLIAEARQLLQVPSAVSQDLTHFTTDPRPILEHRDQVARMLERLQRGD